MQDVKVDKEWLEEMQRGLERIDKMTKHRASDEIFPSLEDSEDGSTQEAEKKPTGRPRKHQGKIKRLTIDIPAGVHRQIKQVALERDKTMTELVTSALTAMIKPHQGC
jgi:hypothetical protein